VNRRQGATLARVSFATLVRNVPVRVLDVSRCGCRLESSERLDPGTAGSLRLRLDGQNHEDDVRIARCQVREGAGPCYFLGVELLPTRRLHDRSIRLAVGHLVGERENGDASAPSGGAREPRDLESEQQARAASRAPPAGSAPWK
jgi:hypothetical protein